MASGKLLILFILIFLATLRAYTQPLYFDQHRVDSLERILAVAAADTNKVQTLIVLSRMYYAQNDSTMSLKYARMGDTLSQQLKYDRGRVQSLAQIAFYYSFRGNWPKSFVAVNEAMPLAERVYPQHKIFLYAIMFVNYATYKRDPKSAKAWGLKAYNDPIFPTLPDGNKWPIIMQLADAYAVLDNLDSANYYANILKTYRNLNLSGPGFLENSDRVLGNIEMKKGNYEVALSYFKQTSENTIHTARAYDSLGQKDSAIHYAKIALDLWKKREFPLYILESSSLLAKLYAETNPRLSNEYLNLYIKTNNDLYNSNTLKEQEELSLKEQSDEFQKQTELANFKNRTVQISLIALATVFLVSALLFFRSNRIKQTTNQKLEKAYSELKSAQTQLIQSEKMASLGELTAGIAHEIQNPLNFVNNFSEVNKDLLREMDAEIEKQNLAEARQIAKNVIENEEKINHHGKRADAIVKGMLQHSRASAGQKEPVDLNALADEYLRLAYHGFRAREKNFNVTMNTNFDPSVGKVNLIPQEIGRVLLNLFNNAFYAVNERKMQLGNNYDPVVSVEIKKSNGTVKIAVKDNGSGIPENIRDKIFQPFFTTKPTGNGTGLGLSLSYDIIKGHGGLITAESTLGKGSEFIVTLPA